MADEQPFPMSGLVPENLLIILVYGALGANGKSRVVGRLYFRHDKTNQSELMASFQDLCGHPGDTSGVSLFERCLKQYDFWGRRIHISDCFIRYNGVSEPHKLADTARRIWPGVMVNRPVWILYRIRDFVYKE